MKSILTIFIVLMISQSNLFAGDCFPGMTISYSPAKHYSIIWQKPTDNATHHLIYAQGKGEKPFFEFIREVCIHWEPQEKYFSLTDYEGSNVSEVYVYKTQGPKKAFDLVDIIPPRVKQLYAKNFHSYIEVLSWTTNGLFAHVWGEGDLSPDGFDVKLKCTMKNSKMSCTEE